MDDPTVASRAKAGQIESQPRSEDVLATYVADMDEAESDFLIEWSATAWIMAGHDSYTAIQQ